MLVLAMVELTRETLKKVVSEVINELRLESVPIGISNRHIHLSEEHFQALFPGKELEPLKPLKQPGEFAAKQMVTLKGPKGEIPKVRILGPLRKRSQVEISMTDSRTLGIEAPIRLSGNLENSANVTLKTKSRELYFQGCIIAKRHIHMSFKDMEAFDLKAGDLVSVAVNTPERETVFEDVELRPGENFLLEMHVDTDEANAANIKPGTVGKVIRNLKG